ncbi:S-methyl-5-thioribose-1-phosphate isomerase [Desulfovibrio sp. OttesenSCG-928-I05]|nr:S-methyl-5-thioribose-1-phosphate isomerase [Desulfovibrio sp. OttesenSCG-928-I05]
MTDHIRFDAQSNTLDLLDQRALPLVEERLYCRTLDSVIEAIKSLAVRGAPAIGVSAAWGCVIAAREAGLDTVGGSDDWRENLDSALDRLAASRPTAVNLVWAVEHMRALWKQKNPANSAELHTLWLAEAARVQAADVAANQTMGAFGAALLDDGDTVLTHCNAGALATAGWGTALGVIRSAIAEGKRIRVISDETRPVLQGARLTAYELARDGIPVMAACDNAAGLLMKKGLVQKIVVGADRIAANGDTANKIGTYGLAVLAKEHGIPFYIAAPLSTIDPTVLTGDGIPIEERPDSEVAELAGTRILPEGVGAYNFAFDVTPSQYIAGIITEAGVLSAPYEQSIAEALRGVTG